VKSGKTGFVGGWNVRRVLKPLLVGDGIGADVSRPNLAY